MGSKIAQTKNQAFETLSAASTISNLDASARSPDSKRRVVSDSVHGNHVSSTPELEDGVSSNDPSKAVENALSIITSQTEHASVPDPSSTKCSPDEYLLSLTKTQLGIELEVKQASSLVSFFAEVTEEQMAAYTTEVVGAVRSNNLEQLKKLHEAGQSLDCSNRFGESLLNMACRRGFVDTVVYLLQHEVDARICDDSGRTPLHDACWNPTPQLKICQAIIEREPALLLVADRRGCTAFQYARMEHWDQWREFLFENRKHLENLRKPEILSHFAKC